MNCNWLQETLKKQGSVTITEADSHKKNCTVCQGLEVKRVIKEVIGILDSTRSSFKSKQIAEAREKLEALL